MMRANAIVLDVVAGLILGAGAYFLVAGMWPERAGPAVAAIALAALTAMMLFRRPHGSLRPWFERAAARLGYDAARPPSWTLDRVLHADIAATTVPGIAIRLLLALMLTGVVLDVLWPALQTRGIEPQRWYSWIVLGLSVAIFLAPELRRLRGRRA